ncbi:cyclopropane fatty acyl phospholipid synthase [Mucilaginibacter sp.]|uniref:cyclopropane fatty acyl phospholipid synthase n=1 Tax=Mucilaginibacter sp. TaxID=1882438 RepID=UPI0026116146|nr:cyclopropane fatty acyl phospholipid synthase [Mucilaginibacter sp.]MDB5030778.1 methyltransferase, cyclopropane fatty acid synthase [Mucilaginibacter sp.]
MGSPKQIIEHLFNVAGIKINGNDPWDIRVNNEKIYDRILNKNSLGMGEGYMEGWWDCDDLDGLFFRILVNQMDGRIPIDLGTILTVLKARLFNQQTKEKAKEVAYKHYDIGNDLYKKMLDKRMIYSCGYWENAQTLDEAQEAKLDLICRKLKLESGMRLLDVGCGWGGLAKYAAEKYGVSVVGVTLSEPQATIAREINKGLPVDIRVQDYRDLNEQFDRIVSVGMFEHVGYKNYSAYMEKISASLTTDGIFLLHTIGGNTTETSTDPWINKYIFPNGMRPSAKQIATAIEPVFVLEDWHNFGLYYDRTLVEWLKNFEQSWPAISKDYNETFHRMWRYYLTVSAVSFRVRKNQLWQIVLTKQSSLKGYQSVR